MMGRSRFLSTSTPKAGDQPHASLRAGPNQTVHELDAPDAEFGKLSPVAIHDRIAKGDWKQFAAKKGR